MRVAHVCDVLRVARIDACWQCVVANKLSIIFHVGAYWCVAYCVEEIECDRNSLLDGFLVIFQLESVCFFESDGEFLFD